MSYAGVESEFEYAQQVIRERQRADWEQSPEGRAAKAARERSEKERTLESARASLVQHREAVKATRKRIARLEKELAE